MNSKPLALLAILGLAGCVDQQLFVKQTLSYDQYERDITACQTASTQSVPVSNQVSWAPYIGLYTVDANEQIRQRNYQICMRDMGYAEATIPYCQGGVATAATTLANNPAHRSQSVAVGAGTCWIARGDGVPFLFTPAAG